MEYLYLYENNLNNKVYIGITGDLARRDYYDHCAGKRQPIDRAIRKHGRSNFTLTVIIADSSGEVIRHEEQYWIARMREFLGKHNVYNANDGGQGRTVGYKHSQQTKKKMSRSRKGIPKSAEAKRKLSISMKLYRQGLK